MKRDLIQFQRLPETIKYCGHKHQRIRVVNFPIPRNCPIFLSDGLRESHPYSLFTHGIYWKKYAKPNKSRLQYGIMLYEGDANLRVLLHEIGHFLDYRNGSDFWNEAEDERNADILGIEYFRKVTGKGIRLRGRTGNDWGKPLLEEV